MLHLAKHASNAILLFLNRNRFVNVPSPLSYSNANAIQESIVVDLCCNVDKKGRQFINRSKCRLGTSTEEEIDTLLSNHIQIQSSFMIQD